MIDGHIDIVGDREVVLPFHVIDNKPLDDVIVPHAEVCQFNIARCGGRGLKFNHFDVETVNIGRESTA